MSRQERKQAAKTEWGVRYAPGSGQVAEYGSGESAEKEARRVAREYARQGKVLVRRTVTYGPWEKVKGGSVKHIVHCQDCGETWVDEDEECTCTCVGPGLETWTVTEHDEG